MTVDVDARTRIAGGEPEALFVEAGAGTGKTTALVARVVRLVVRGDLLPDVAQLAAITFTENAAAELRTRIRQALVDAVPQHQGDERRRLEQALERLDDAAVTTLHGFAQRLLADLPLEAGLPPGFAVEDDIRAGLDRDRWWTALLDELFADPILADTWRTGLTLGLKPTDLRAVADAFAANWDQLPAGPAAAPALPPWRTLPVVEALRGVVDRYADPGPAGDLLTVHLREVLRPALADLDAEPDELGRAAVLDGLKVVSRRGGAAAWKKQGLDKADVVADLQHVAQQWEEQRDEVRAAVLAALVERVRVAVLQDAERRREEGRLHFHDLLVRARDLLRDVPDARQALSQRWQVLLVDEFQDTDPLQAELVHLLAASTVDGQWQQAQVDPGRLFFVGDPKQSIYRFRRADVQLYQQVQGLVPQAGQLSLTSNFRSRPAVLDVVNAGLARLMEGDGQVKYERLAAHREAVAQDPGPDVLLLGGPHEEAVSAVRPVEAAHVAATCRRAKDEGWQVRDGDEGTRTVRFADIAVLVPTRTSLGALEDALQAHDVPYRVESRSLVWETDAVRDLLRVLEAVEDPADEVALVAALRHPGFACDDDDLVLWRARGGSWSPFAPVPEDLQDSPVAAALAALREYHELRHWLPVNQLVERVVRERHLVELTTALPRPRDHWRRLRFVVDQARAFLDAGGAGLGEFVRWAAEQAERGADAVESALPEPDDDAVRILTVHASKGLEFPVVVLTGINVEERLRTRVAWTGTGPEVQPRKGFCTPGWSDAEARERVLDAAEAVRVLYVGVTRAVDHLVVSLHHKAKRNGTPSHHAGRLHALLPDLVAAGAVHEAAPADLPPAAVGTAAREPMAVEEHLAFRKARQALLEEVTGSLPVTPSGLAASAEPQEPVDPLEESEPASAPASLGPAPRRVSGGAALGTLVHRALELVDLRAPDPEAAADLACLEAGAPHLRTAVLERVRVAVASPLLQEVAGLPHWKELPVVAELDGRLVEGFVDLVFQRPEGLVVVDYKTDAVRDEAERASKAAHYAPQVDAYRRAVATATGLPVVAAGLLFLGPTEAVAVLDGPS